MRFYRALRNVNQTPEGGIIELPDDQAATLLESGAIEEANADHLVKRYGAIGALDADLEKDVEKMRATVRRVNQQIADLDAHLSSLADERARLLSGDVHKEDAMALIRADIQRKGRKFEQRMLGEYFACKRAPYSWNVAQMMQRDVRGDTEIPFLGNREASGMPSQDALYFLFPDQIEAGFRKILDGLEWDEGATRLDLIQGRVESIQREMADLQAQRNNLSEQLAGVGIE